jgi:NTE family protein
MGLVAMAQTSASITTANINGLPDPTPDNDQFIFVPLLPTVGQTLKSDKITQHPPRVVLALGGGGMRGAAHVGVLKVLIKAGIPIDGIAGTSMGAVVGGLYSAGMPVSEIETRFTSGSLMKSFVPESVPVRIMMAPIVSSPRLIGFRPYDGLYIGKAFRKYLDKAVPEDKKTIESLRIPFVAIAINVCDGHPYSIAKGNLVDAMRASSAVPSLRKPIEINGRLFVDGGYLANLPVPHARALNGDVVIAVQIDEPFHKQQPDDFRKVGSIAKRMFDLQLSALDAVYARSSDILIHPDLEGVGLMSTKICDAKRAVAAGEIAAEQALPAIKQKLQALGIATVPGNI